MLEGKVIAVTGGGRGIGRSIALLCASEGAKIVLNDIGGADGEDQEPSDPARLVVEEIRDHGGEAVANRASVADPAGAASIIDDAILNFGRIDGVVNNAGLLRDKIFHKMTVEEWDIVIQVHLNGCFHVARAAAPHFRNQGSGAFVHFVSTTGLIGNVGQANYAAAKSGIVGLSTSIALDMRRFGVRSNCVAPTAWTRLVETVPADTAERRDRLEQLKSMSPDKIAPLVAFLCSDAASEVSGQIFGVRKDEIFLYSRPTILRTMQMSDGWTPRSCAEVLLPALKPSFQPLLTTAEVISWDTA